MTRDDIKEVYDQGLDSVCIVIESLETRLAAIESRLKMNSRNSSKPPSSDGVNKPKPKSQRKPSGKKSGGQEGHEGKTLNKVENPDDIIVHKAPEKCHCGHDLKKYKKTIRQTDSRQVFDLPEIRLRVTEHQRESVVCRCCGSVHHGSFPEAVSQPTQYGERLTSYALYLHAHQFLTAKRGEELFRDLFQAGVSAGTVVNMQERFAQRLAVYEQAIRDNILKVPTAHADETGVRVMKKLMWLHTFSSGNYSAI